MRPHDVGVSILQILQEDSVHICRSGVEGDFSDTTLQIHR